MPLRFHNPAIRRLLLAAALCAVGIPPALAQDQPQPAPKAGPRTPQPTPAELEPFEGKLIRSIVFNTPSKPNPTDPKGPPVPGGPLESAIEALARNQLRLKEGAPFSAALVSEDISRLNRLGRFKRVENHVQLLADDSVELIYTVEPQPLIAAVQSVGNRKFNDQEVIGGIDVLVGTPVDPTQLDRAARHIEDLYHSKGYHNALVTIDQKELSETGVVLFRIREGERTKVTVINFDGNLSYSPRELRTVVKTSEHGLFNTGALDNDMLDADVAALIAYYRERGYLDVNVNRHIITSPDQREAIVNFDIFEGRVYTLRLVQQINAADESPVFEIDQLLSIMKIRSGDIYSEARIKKSIDAIKDAFAALGYTDVQILEPITRRDTVLPQVDVILVIRQGRKFKTGEVVIQGNPLTRDNVIRRELFVQPERPLDTSAVKMSEDRLRQTNLFDRKGVKLTIQPEDPVDSPGYRDVLVQVQETNTGSVNIGGSVDTDGGLVAQISITQRNFDISDWPDSWGELFRGEALRGGGQTFNIKFQPGTVQNDYSLGLSDPHLFDSEYSGSANAFYHSRDYNTYTEHRYGAQFSVGEHFGSRWEASVPFGIQNVWLTAIEPDAPVDYFDVADTHTLANAGLHLTRKSFDNVAFPAKGNMVDFGIDQYIPPGDFTFTNLHAEYATYLRLSEDVLGRSTTLQLKTSSDYIPQASSTVPFYQRHYLGGSDFRGFDFRAVSPIGIRHDNGQLGDDTVGGTFKFFAGAEVRQPLYEDLLSGVLFCDSGTVDDSVSFDKYRVSVGFGFRIVYSPVSPAPFAFDFGFPLLKQDTDKTRIFSFSIAIPFR